MRKLALLLPSVLILACPKKESAPDAAAAPAAEVTEKGPPRIVLALTEPAAKPKRPLYYEREITQADLEGRSLYELTLLRNWIYARTGNVFFKQWLHDFFEAEAWYKPTGLDESKLSAIDKKNAELIAAYEGSLSKAELEKRRNALIAKYAYARREPAEAIAISPDGKLAATGAESASLWELSSGRELAELETAPPRIPEEEGHGPPDSVTGLGFSPDGGKVAIVRRYGKISVHDLAAKKIAASLELKTGEAEAYFAREPWRALICADGRCRVFDLATLKEVGPGFAESFPAALSSDGKRALAVADKSVQLVDVEKGEVVKTIDAGGSAGGLAFSGDGRRAAVITNTNRVAVIDLEKGAVINSFFVANLADSVALSPDGTRAVVGARPDDDVLEGYDVERGKASWIIAGAAGPAAFTPDGKRALGGGRVLSLVDVAGGTRVASFAGHEPIPSEDVAIELQLLSRSLGLASPIGAESARSPLDDPHLLDELVSVDRLRDLSRRDLRLIRNMIFARRGRPFKKESVRAYFERMDWYQADPAYTDKRLTKTDHDNIKIVLSVEKERGGPMSEDEQLNMEMA